MESSRERVTRSAPCSRHQMVPRSSWMFAWVEMCVSMPGMVRLTSKNRPQSWMIKASAPSVEQRWMSCSASLISDSLMTMFTVT